MGNVSFALYVEVIFLPFACKQWLLAICSCVPSLKLTVITSCKEKKENTQQIKKRKETGDDWWTNKQTDTDRNQNNEIDGRYGRGKTETETKYRTRNQNIRDLTHFYAMLYIKNYIHYLHVSCIRRAVWENSYKIYLNSFLFFLLFPWIRHANT